MGLDLLEERILESLEEKPRSITEVARELDEDKYEVSKKIEVLKEKELIKTYKIGRSTACLLAEEAPDKIVEENVEETEEENEGDSKDVGDMEVTEEVETDSEGPKTIGVVSGKGGVGKTVVTLNLGAALMDFDQKVMVMDADAEMSNLGMQLGMYTFPNSLEEVIEQNVHIMSALHVDKNSGLRVLPTSLSAESVGGDVKKAIDMIPDEYTVLIDSPPGYERPIERVIEVCDELIFVTAPELPAVTDTYKPYKEARNTGKTAIGA
ncbi:MAG: AAA family ATPase, partial [Candidatus Aenigmatarchaeota archaeon]